MVTQVECKQDFLNLLDDTSHRIGLIDKRTPADTKNPDMPPTWWEKMMQLKREIDALRLEYWHERINAEAKQ